MAEKESSSLSIALRGFAMGCADIVPGVSGGTVALVTGIYGRLIAAVQSVVQALPLLLRFKWTSAWKRVDTGLLVPLFIGLFCAIGAMSHLITKAMTEAPELTWGLFLGLMIGSLLVVGRMTKTRQLRHWALALMAANLAWMITVSTPVETEASPRNFFLSGMVAIAAMILPGISGSFLLLIMGKYLQVIGAIKGCLSALKALLAEGFGGTAAQPHWDALVQHGIVELFPFAAGCAIGLGLFSWLLNRLFKRHHDMMICILAGLMAGSLHKLWPFREVTLYLHREGKPDKVLQDMAVMPYWDSPLHWGAIALVVFGFVLVMVVDRLAKGRGV